MDAPADPRSLRLSELSDCACRLGKAFAEEAERAEAWERRLELFKLFDRCFFAVRVATALELRLLRTPTARTAARDDNSDRDDDELEAPDWEEAAERSDERERDRERETERASLPVLLRTLEGVAADAEDLPGPKPAALPTLRELLTHVKAAPPSATSAEPTLRGRLVGSGSTATLTAPAELRGSFKILGPTRRATGPPRR